MRLLGEEVLKEEGGGGPAIVIDNRDGADGKTYTPPSWKEQRWDEQRRWGGGHAMFVRRDVRLPPGAAEGYGGLHVCHGQNCWPPHGDQANAGGRRGRTENHAWTAVIGSGGCSCSSQSPRRQWVVHVVRSPHGYQVNAGSLWGRTENHAWTALIGSGGCSCSSCDNTDMLFFAIFFSQWKLLHNAPFLAPNVHYGSKYRQTAI